MCAGNGRPCERSDGAPGLIGGDFEMALRPLPQSGNRRRRPHEAKIELGFIDWSLTGVTFSKKLQHDALAEVLRQRDVRLQCDAFARRARQQIAQPCNGGVASICALLMRGRENPRWWLSIFQSPLCAQRCDDCFLANQRANFASASQQKIIEETAFYRNFAIVSSWKIDSDFATVDGDELDRGEFGMRQIQNPRARARGAPILTSTMDSYNRHTLFLAEIFPAREQACANQPEHKMPHNSIQPGRHRRLRHQKFPSDVISQKLTKTTKFFSSTQSLCFLCSLLFIISPQSGFGGTGARFNTRAN